MRHCNKIMQIGNLTIGATRKNPNRNRVYGTGGIAPCIVDYSGGGNLQPIVPVVYETF